MSIKESLTVRKAVRFVAISGLFIAFLTGTFLVSANALVDNHGSSSSNTPSSNAQLYPLPKSSYPASNLDVVSIGGQGSSLAYTIAALQGIVNRNQPQIFTIQNQDDNLYLQYIENTYGFKTNTISKTQVLQQFSSYVSDGNGNVKIIEFDSNDPLFPMQVDMAKTLSGVYNALPVASNDLSTIQSIFGSKITILYDLVGMFSNKVTAYTWLWNLVSNNVTRSFLVMSPEGRVGITDYITEFKAFVFEFCCVSAGTTQTLNSSETALANEIISAYPSMTVVLGFFGLGGEVQTVSYLSQKGDVMISSDEAADLSVYSGLPNASLKPVLSQQMTYDKTKTYVMFEITQGDAFMYDYYNNFDEFRAVDSSTGQMYISEVPAAWQISPVLAEVAPPILQYWYSLMTPQQSFMTGPSCAGYTHPDIMPNEQSFEQLCDGLDNAIGLNQQFIILNSVTTSTLQNYISATSTANTIWLWQQNGHAPQIVDNVPVFYAAFWEAAGSTFSSSDVSTAVSQIQTSSSEGNHFVYVIFNAQNPGLPFVQQVMGQLGSSYVAVNGNQFSNLYMQSQGITTTSSFSSTTSTSTITPTISSSTSTQSTTTTPTTSTSHSTSTTSHSSSSTTASSTSSTHTSTSTTTDRSTSTTSRSTSTTTSTTTLTTTITTSSLSSTTTGGSTSTSESTQTSTDNGQTSASQSSNSATTTSTGSNTIPTSTTSQSTSTETTTQTITNTPSSTTTQIVEITSTIAEPPTTLSSTKTTVRSTSTVSYSPPTQNSISSTSSTVSHSTSRIQQVQSQTSGEQSTSSTSKIKTVQNSLDTTFSSLGDSISKVGSALLSAAMFPVGVSVPIVSGTLTSFGVFVGGMIPLQKYVLKTGRKSVQN